MHTPSRIAINTRLLQQKWSGVPYYIKKLFQAVWNIQDNVLFFQTEGEHTLGETKRIACSAHGIAGIFFDVLGVLQLIFKWKPAIFHGPSFILPFWKPKRCKYVVTIHDLSLRTMPHLYRFTFRVLYRRLIARSIAKADAIVVVSQHTKKDVMHYYGVDPKNIMVSYPGLNEIFLRAQVTKRLIEEPYVLSLTTHPKRKNILSVIEALAVLKEHHIVIRYVVVGIIGKKQTEMLCAQAEKYGVRDQVTLRWYATEEELISLYRHAEVFVYPSFYEGFGFPIIEAMASKTLVITSHTSSMQELMQDTRFLVEPTRVEDIAAKLISTLRLPEHQKHEVIERNYQFCQQFSWAKSAQQHQELYERLLRG